MSGIGLERPSTRVPAGTESWTILKLLLWSAHYLEGKGVPSPRLDAEHLLAETLEAPRLHLYLEHDRPLQPEELAAFKPLLLRRALREPLQYILGRAPFRELELEVNERVLIPRPETELLAGEVLAWSRERAEPGLRALDIGTGSGALAIALATEGSFAAVVATDVSPGAIALAARNRERHPGGASVDFRVGSLYEPLRREEGFDVIVSNPPYIAVADVPGLQPEVRDWEPEGALLAGSEGMDVLAPLIAGAGRHLNPGGLLALETGEEQAHQVARLMEAAGVFGPARVVPDLARRDRMVLALRSGGAPDASRCPGAT